MRGPRDLLYLLLISMGTTDALTVTMKAPLISVMRDEDVTIPCEFTDFIPGKTINVGWKKSQNGQSSDVYIYIPGQAQSFRPGAYMEEESEIRRGNAALHIPRVQYSDDGEYTCNVAVTTDGNKEMKSTLQVSAVPSAVLEPGDDITVEERSEKSMTCDVSNFYPKDIDIYWVRYEKDSSKYEMLERGTCTGGTIANTDGTFSVISQLTLYPTMEDNGHRYSCVVKHRSLDQDLKMNFTLTVTEREDNTGTVVTAVILTVLSIILPLLAFFLYKTVYNKDPPRFYEITRNDQLIDMTRTTLTYHMMNFKPNDLEISICLKRSGEEMMRIHTWRSRDHDPFTWAVMHDNDGEGSVDIDMEHQRLMNWASSHTQGPQLEMTPVITPNRSGLLRCIQWRRLYTYSCQCSIHITPSYSEDNGAEFSVYVSHPALTAPIHKKKILKVIGVPPRLLKIVSPVYMTHGEPMILTCPITAFKPKPIQITWIKKDPRDQETQIITWNSNDRNDIKGGDHNVTENELDDKSYSFLSALTIKPNVKEDGVRYICRTFHPATDRRAEEECVLKVTAVPVLGPITQTLGKDKINVGDTMSLSCKIHSFYPKDIKVTWYTEDGLILPSTISVILPDQSGLYQVTSSINYTPSMKDLGKTFTCDVRHESTGAPKTATWPLQELVYEPTVSEIRCDPPSPQCYKMVTLSCDVSNLYPREITVQWHKGRIRIPPNMCTETTEKDPESGTFKGRIELSLKADSECHEKEYRMELNHHGKTIERKYRLNLKGFMTLDDITSDPSDPIYGHPVTLYCKVTNAKPEDIKVQWFKGEKPVEKGQGEEKQITEKDGSVSCSLRIITITALDYGKAYTCSVTHKDMKEPLKKNHYIALPDKIPMFSDITVRPERPVAGQEAIFTVTISGFTPDIQVRWYKDFGPFPSDVIDTSDPQIGKDFLCTCSSSLRFPPKDTDHMASIRCEATHSVTKKVYAKAYTLQLAGGKSEKPKEPPKKGSLKTPQKIPLKTQGIQCLTERPRVGEEVTLTCYVKGCDANDAEFFWRKGLFPIESGIQNRTEEDGSGSFSTVTFIAQESDRDCNIVCEVTYILETQEEHFTLKLQ